MEECEGFIEYFNKEVTHCDSGELSDKISDNITEKMNQSDLIPGLITQLYKLLACVDCVFSINLQIFVISL